MREYYSQILILNRPQLVDEIEPTELLNHLLSKNVLTKRQTKSISCMADPYKQNEAILDALHRRPDEDFDKFCQALIETNQTTVVESYLKPKAQQQSASSASSSSSTTVIAEASDESPNPFAVLDEFKDLGIDVRDTDFNLRSVSTITPRATSEESVSQPNRQQSDWEESRQPIDIAEIVVEPSTQEFYLSNRLQSYPMDKDCRGRCVIICNSRFAPAADGSQSLSFREGYDADVLSMKELFAKLQFKVAVHENVAAEEMRKIVKEVAEDESLAEDQCFVLFVMSHGKCASVRLESGDLVSSEMIYGADGELVAANSLLKPLTNDYCRRLAGKPKLAFFQACRGAEVDRTETDCVLSTDDVSTSGQLQLSSMGQQQQQQHPVAGESDASMSACQDPAQPVKPSLDTNEHSKDRPLNLKDFLIGYPSQCGYRSFRNTVLGSWYVNAMVRVFAKHACDTDVASMLRMVNSRVSRWVSNCGTPALSNSGQCAEMKDCLTKEKLFLFPGIRRLESEGTGN